MAKATKLRVGRAFAQTGTTYIAHRTTTWWPLRMLAGAIRLRAEILVLTVLITAWSLVDRVIASSMSAWLIIAGLAGALFTVPITRRFLWRRVWCVICRHRIRKCLVERHIMTDTGRPPLLLWCRPTAVGERAWMLLRPGQSPQSVIGNTEEIASACWAREARVEINTKRTAFIWVDIARRDPLAGATSIGSDVLAGVPVTPTTGQVIPLPDRTTVTATATRTDTTPAASTGTGTDGTATTTTITDPPTRRGRNRTTTATTTAATAAEPTVTGWSGEDVSDYV